MVPQQKLEGCWIGREQEGGTRDKGRTSMSLACEVKEENSG